MENKKINASILLCIAFLAAALGSTFVAALCMFAILFFCKDQELGAQSVEAVVLSLVAALCSNVVSAFNTVLNLIPGNFVISIVRTITGTLMGFVDLAVFVVGIMAALNAFKKEKVNIPFISGKFDGIFTDK